MQRVEESVVVMDATSFARRVTSSRSCCTSDRGVAVAATVGRVVTSMILSAILVSFGRSVERSAEARTMCTLAERRWEEQFF